MSPAAYMGATQNLCCVLIKRALRPLVGLHQHMIWYGNLSRVPYGIFS